MDRTRIYAAVGIIFCIGIFFRTVYLNRTVWPQLNYDEARNTLVARHIVDYREQVWRGPQVGGADNKIQNSPVFYYLLASFWFVTRSALGVAIVWAILQSLIIFVAFGVGKHLWDDTLGLLSALFAAVFYPFIESARNITEANILPLLFYLFLWLMTVRHKISVAFMCIAVLILASSVFFYYAGVPVLLPGMIWIAYVCIGKYRKERSVMWLLAPFMTFLICVAYWILLTYARMPFDQFTYAAGLVKANWPDVLTSSRTAARLFADTLWANLDIRLEAVVSFLILTYLGTCLTRKRSSLSGKSTVVWIIFLIVTALIMFALHGNFIENYPSSIAPFGMVVIAYCMRLLLDRHRIIGSLGICCVTGIYLASSIYGTQVFIRQPLSPFEGEGAAALAIYHDIRSKPSAKPLSFDVKFLHVDYLPLLPPDNWWGSSPLWFILEQRLGMKLVTLTDKGEYFTRAATGYPHDYYLFCDYTSLPHNRVSWSRACLDAFRKRYEGLSDNIVRIYSSEESDVWRLHAAVADKE